MITRLSCNLRFCWRYFLSILYVFLFHFYFVHPTAWQMTRSKLLSLFCAVCSLYTLLFVFCWQTTYIATFVQDRKSKPNLVYSLTSDDFHSIFRSALFCYEIIVNLSVIDVNRATHNWDMANVRWKLTWFFFAFYCSTHSVEQPDTGDCGVNIQNNVEQSRKRRARGELGVRK